MSLLQSTSKLSIYLFLTVFVIIISISTSYAQPPELLLEIRDSTFQTTEGEQRLLLINMSNYNDTVAGFNIWLKLGNPDIMTFQTDDSTVVDTTYWKCIAYEGEDCLEYILTNPLDYDSSSIDTNDVQIGSWDTTGTLISGWASVDARSISGLGTDLNICGIAYSQANPNIPGIPPGNHDIPFIKVPFEVVEYPPYGDTFYAEVIIDGFPVFYNPAGDLIGSISISYDTTIDTSYYICTQWVGDECFNWQVTTEPPYDSIYIDTIIVPYIDTNSIIIINGNIPIYPECIPIVPGDVDGSGEYDITDLIYLTDFILYGEPPLPIPPNGDVSGDCIINGYDLTLLAFGGPFTPCTCTDPQWVCCRGYTGNANNDINDEVLVDDLTFLVDYLFKGGSSPTCIEEALINPYTDNTSPDVSDLVHLVNYLFKGGELPDVCPGQ